MLRIRCEAGVDPDVRGTVLRFAAWLRGEYEFPVPLRFYVSPREQLVTRKGEAVSAYFFWPDPGYAPHARVAVGDFAKLARRRGRDNALASILCSVAHEVIHYQQWIAGDEWTEAGIGDASVAMVDAYAQTVDHP